MQYLHILKVTKKLNGRFSQFNNFADTAVLACMAEDFLHSVSVMGLLLGHLNFEMNTRARLIAVLIIIYNSFINNSKY